MLSSKRWEALLTGADREQALDAVAALQNALDSAGGYGDGWQEDDSTTAVHETLLSTGKPGVALAYAYAGKCTNAVGPYRVAERLLDETTAALATTPLGTGLWTGVGGVAWLLAHVDRLGAADAFAGDWSQSGSEIDELLTAYTRQPAPQLDFDLINGVVGLGVCALERFPAPSAVNHLDAVIERLSEGAETTQDGMTWFTPPALLDHASSARFPQGCYHLGVAHGVAGVVSFLAAVLLVLPHRADVATLLERATAWLRRQCGDGRFSYPREIGRNGVLEMGRASWCNGNVGIAVALLKAALALRDPKLERHAIEIALCVSGVSPQEARIVDACICHGSAGIAHMLNRMYQATRDERLRDGACSWYRLTLQWRRDGAGIGGYAFGTMAGGAAVPVPGFLMGAAGVLAALLAGLFPHEPQWDRAMLLDLSPRTA